MINIWITEDGSKNSIFSVSCFYTSAGLFHCWEYVLTFGCFLVVIRLSLRHCVSAIMISPWSKLCFSFHHICVASLPGRWMAYCCVSRLDLFRLTLWPLWPLERKSQQQHLRPQVTPSTVLRGQLRLLTSQHTLSGRTAGPTLWQYQLLKSFSKLVTDH